MNYSVDAIKEINTLTSQYDTYLETGEIGEELATFSKDVIETAQVTTKLSDELVLLSVMIGVYGAKIQHLNELMEAKLADEETHAEELPIMNDGQDYNELNY